MGSRSNVQSPGTIPPLPLRVERHGRRVHVRAVASGRGPAPGRAIARPAAGSTARVAAMARVVVVGGGFGGAASAARLAKLGHDVTLRRAAADRLGGALGSVEQDGFRWDAGPTRTLLPAVLRDLFRKSGRPLEKELELVPVEPVRQHRFADDDPCSTCPAGAAPPRSRRSTRRSGAGWASGGRRTSTTFADDWEALRRDWLERP